MCREGAVRELSVVVTLIGYVRSRVHYISKNKGPAFAGPFYLGFRIQFAPRTCSLASSFNVPLVRLSRSLVPLRPMHQIALQNPAYMYVDEIGDIYFDLNKNLCHQIKIKFVLTLIRFSPMLTYSRVRSACLESPFRVIIEFFLRNMFDLIQLKRAL